MEVNNTQGAQVPQDEYVQADLRIHIAVEMVKKGGSADPKPERNVQSLPLGSSGGGGEGSA